jgi:hypothetical protein
MLTILMTTLTLSQCPGGQCPYPQQPIRQAAYTVAAPVVNTVQQTRQRQPIRSAFRAVFGRCR